MSDNTDFGTFGRFTETPVSEMPAEMRQAYDYTLKLRGLVPGPHKIWLANPKLSRTIVPAGAYYQTESTLAKAEIEIATSVINGRWGAAYANYEHEKIGIEQGHLAPEKTSDAVKVSSCSGKFLGGVGECGGFVVFLAGDQAVVEAAEHPAEQVALGGGVPVAAVFAAVVVGAGAG
jgi:hypothetical protein